MHVPLRLSAIAIAAGITLGGCAYDPYGGLSVGVGYGSGYGGYGYGYDPYYGKGYYGGYTPYGYGSRYGYGGYAPYFGWYDGFYYPGSGYYVYDAYRRPYRWTDEQRTYWQQRQQAYQSSGTTTRQISDNWSDFRRDRRSPATSGEFRRRPVREPVRTQQGTSQASQAERRTQWKAERLGSLQQRQEARRERQEPRHEGRRDKDSSNKPD